jgi:hypothetical protein
VWFEVERDDFLGKSLSKFLKTNKVCLLFIWDKNCKSLEVIYDVLIPKWEYVTNIYYNIPQIYPTYTINSTILQLF